MKRWKKMILFVMALNMVFFAYESQKKEAHASMTLAAAIATYGVKALIGLAGTIAVGGVVANWDTVTAYGGKVIDRLGGAANVTDLITSNEDGTAGVLYTSAMKLAMANAVDDMPDTLSVSDWNELGNFSFYNGQVRSPELGALPAGYTLALKFDYVLTSTNPYYGAQLDVRYNTPHDPYAAQKQLAYYRGLANSTETGSTIVTHDSKVNYENFTLQLIAGGASVSMSNAKYSIYPTGGVLPAEREISTSDTFGGAASTVSGRLLNMNTAISDNQMVNFNTQADVMNVTLDNLTAISDATLNENQTQTGFLATIWSAIKGIPANVYAAFAGSIGSVQNTLDNLWEDAGKVWTGIKDDVNNLNTFADTVIVGAYDGILNGIDAIKGAMGNWLEGIDTGIKDFGATANGWLEGIDAGVRDFGLSLTGFSADVVAGLDAIGARALALPQTLLDDIAEIKALVVPTDLAMTDYTAKMDELRNKFYEKFEFITIPIQTLKSLYASPRSLYDLSFEIMGQRVHVLPRLLAPAVDAVRPILTGAAVVVTFISIYRKFSPREVIGS